MKVAVLWTGGKDSSLACHKVMEEHDVSLFVNFNWSKPSLSHPQIITKLQSEVMLKPFLWQYLKPPYLESYREAILRLKNEYGIEAVVTGDIGYVDAFHGNWINDVCKGTDVRVIKPLWEQDRQSILHELVEGGFTVVFTCIKGPWLTEEWLGRTIDDQAIGHLRALRDINGLDICGEFGEYHTMTLDAPFFTKTIKLRLFRKLSISNGFAIEPLQLSLTAK